MVLISALPHASLAQEVMDSAAVAQAMLASLDSSWVTSHERREQGPYHPNGAPVAFCIGFGWGPGKSDVGSLPPSIREVVRDHVVEWYALRPSDGCRARVHHDSGLRGVVDERGRLAVIVEIGIELVLVDRATVHFGVVNGGFGAWGVTCTAERTEEAGWRTVERTCRYYES